MSKIDWFPPGCTFFFGDEDAARNDLSGIFAVAEEEA